LDRRPEVAVPRSDQTVSRAVVSANRREAEKNRSDRQEVVHPANGMSMEIAVELTV